ncbi:hypothetical protein L227DRAFT_303316 [Lentinus tigrinus ALCF2SS1-6]|uniref:Uncharacterized protein n=1 Tax=Lentinus tigrinus ALCF2SS1-6 TaxID=1328759 RepID=A0A5C2RWD0_9APHY|nr:hypothetical protein L227DRAFT_303316 [Lentinus tigrinus ALCF2SS1-6]
MCSPVRAHEGTCTPRLRLSLSASVAFASSGTFVQPCAAGARRGASGRRWWEQYSNYIGAFAGPSRQGVRARWRRRRGTAWKSSV